MSEDNTNIEKPNLRLPFEHYRAKEGHVNIQVPGGNYSPTESAAALKQTMSQNPDKKDIKDIRTEATGQASRLEASSAGLWNDGRYDEIVADIDDLSQVNLVDGKPVGIVPASVNTKKMNKGKIGGNTASRVMRRALGTGKDGLITLDHSGFTVRIGKIAPRERFALMMTLRGIRDGIGVQTKGQMFTTDDVKLNKAIMDFCFSKIIDSSLMDYTIEKIRNLMLPQDTIALMTGVLDFMFPDGIPTIQECTNSFKATDACDWSTLADIDRLDAAARLIFRRTFLRKNSKIDTYCLKQLAKPMGTVSEEEVESYQSRLIKLHMNVKPIRISDANEMTIDIIPRIPSYAEYEKESMATTTDVLAEIDEVLNSQEDMEGLSNKQAAGVREARINEYMDYVVTRKFSAWVDKLQINDSEGTFVIEEDEDTGRQDLIDEVTGLAENTDVGAEFIKQMEKWLVGNQFTFNALPSFKCPKCRSPQSERLHEVENLIPISMPMYFFTTIALSRAF